MRISDWSSDVCSSDLVCRDIWIVDGPLIGFGALGIRLPFPTRMTIVRLEGGLFIHSPTVLSPTLRAAIDDLGTPQWIIGPNTIRSDEHTSELQSIMRISYAVFRLKKTKRINNTR